MAKITEVVFQKPVEPVIETLTLELTGKEALFLRDLLARIGGMHDTRRGLADAILVALESKLGDKYNTKDFEGNQIGRAHV